MVYSKLVQYGNANRGGHEEIMIVRTICKKKILLKKVNFPITSYEKRTMLALALTLNIKNGLFVKDWIICVMSKH